MLTYTDNAAMVISSDRDTTEDDMRQDRGERTGRGMGWGRMTGRPEQDRGG